MEIPRRIKWYVFGSAVVVLGVGFSWFHEPDAFFQSSDANWADSEFLWKGRDFEAIVTYFELYKIKCDAPKATLIRTSARNPWNAFAWYNYLTDPKWQVPYGKGDESIGKYYPRASSDHCANRATSDSEWDTAKTRALRFISSLRAD